MRLSLVKIEKDGGNKCNNAHLHHLTAKLLFTRQVRHSQPSLWNMTRVLIYTYPTTNKSKTSKPTNTNILHFANKNISMGFTLIHVCWNLSDKCELAYSPEQNVQWAK